MAIVSSLGTKQTFLRSIRSFLRLQLPQDIGSRRQLSSKRSSESSMSRPAAAMTCEVDAEPLQRYRAGGYHPVHIGDLFDGGRYRVENKLGWGAYGTVWLAKDLK